ncbi:DUF433 domain-containing protein [Sphingomonas sp.]
MNAHVGHKDLWRSRLELPNYEVREAGKYASISSATVARWHRNTTLGERTPHTKLSYLQLIELAVAAACKKAGMKLADIRTARAYFAGAFKTEHPFATVQLMTDGIDLAAKAGAELLIGNKRGQLAWNHIIGDRFKEFKYEDGLATRWHVAGVDSDIVIDPRVRFGAPSVSGVPTWAVKGRWEAGESLEDIADDFSLLEAQVSAALKFEGVDTSAAKREPWSH